MQAVARLAGTLGLDPASIPGCYLEALQWTDDALADRIAAVNLFLDRPKERRRYWAGTPPSKITWRCEPSNSPTVAPRIGVRRAHSRFGTENRFAGTVRLHCNSPRDLGVTWLVEGFEVLWVAVRGDRDGADAPVVADEEVLVPREKIVFYRNLSNIAPDRDEPMMNVVAWHDRAAEVDRGWRLVVFPRAKHRPSAYFAEGDAVRWERARYAEFRVDPAGRALLVGLADQHLQRIPTAP